MDHLSDETDTGGDLTVPLDQTDSVSVNMSAMTDDTEREPPQPPAASSPRAEYCAELQRWMWQYYWGCSGWQSCLALSALPPPCALPPPATSAPAPAPPPRPGPGFHWHVYTYTVATQRGGHGLGARPRPGSDGRAAAPQQDRNPPQAGREYTIPSLFERFLAEMLDFIILFCVKAAIVLWIMHMSGMKDIAKFVRQFIMEEIDENTSMEDIRKMMVVAVVYRVLVCVYETICIWGAGGATPGKFLCGLQVVTCHTTTVVRPNRVLIVPASSVSLSASTGRALNKNFSIAFLFPIFITLLFFQHNRTVYDIVAGTIVVQRRDGR